LRCWILQCGHVLLLSHLAKARGDTQRQSVRQRIWWEGR
jgi:hypothetical protein